MAKVGKGFQIGVSWVPLKGRGVPPGAIDIGDGVYVARGCKDGEQIPGKYVEKYGTCYVSYGGAEHELKECEILCDTCISSTGCCYEWREDSGGNVPKNAIVGGIAEDGEPLYICRAKVDGEKCVGKVHNGHDCAYIPHGGEEHSVEDYKVLCLRKK
ncbi:unnamed protein product [Rodentolepis nana]|uniref:DUF3421 domain-containing protein n=1 Tax=Rodentolepis nana TaxID=102285 RepID=A0A0R3T053_RODNA|nr:unnamed protein product [Rodentolepis nana]